MRNGIPSLRSYPKDMSGKLRLDTKSAYKRADTFMRTISSGMFIMAPVSQLSRLLAKLRMA